jgi:hypothetical protein
LPQSGYPAPQIYSPKRFLKAAPQSCFRKPLPKVKVAL